MAYKLEATPQAEDNSKEITISTDRLILILSTEASEQQKANSEPPSQEQTSDLSALLDMRLNAHSQKDTLVANVFLKESGEAIGYVSMRHIDQPLPEYGIELSEEHRNRGYGPEATIAFCNWFAENYDIGAIQVRIAHDNTHSIHIFEKLGAVFEKSSPYFSERTLALLGDSLSDKTMASLARDAVRNYTLALPLSDISHNKHT